MKKWQWAFLIFVLLVLAANIGYLNYLVVFDKLPSVGRRIELAEKRLDSLIRREDGSVVELDEEGIAKKAAEMATEEVEGKVKEMIPIPTPKVAEVVEEQVAGVSQVKEFFVPIGGGSTSSSDWTGMPSAQVTVDSSKYGKIQAVYFEASLYVVNGYLSARLVNNTDGMVYHDSEISHDGQSGAWKTSKAIFLAGGSKNYEVQLRSSSGELGIMDQARLRIIVE